MTVRQLLSSLDSRELAEWAAFFKIEREDYAQKSEGRRGVELSERIKSAFRGKGY